MLVMNAKYRTGRARTGIFALCIASAAVMLVAATGVAGIQESSAAKMTTYEVTVTNIMPGQPITPPLLITHAKDAGIFSVGHEATEQLQQLAENGNAMPLVDSITGMDGISEIVRGTAHLVPANDPAQTGLAHSETFTITADGGHRYLSFASMLVCTNDGFAGIDGVKLPYAHSKTVYAKAYDARTEMNTEDFADMVPPCQGEIGVSSDDEGTGSTNAEISETGVVIPHPGVMGVADLTDVHKWSNPAVRIDIMRIG